MNFPYCVLCVRVCSMLCTWKCRNTFSNKKSNFDCANEWSKAHKCQIITCVWVRLNSHRKRKWEFAILQLLFNHKFAEWRITIIRPEWRRTIIIICIRNTPNANILHEWHFNYLFPIIWATEDVNHSFNHQSRITTQHNYFSRKFNHRAFSEWKRAEAKYTTAS